ncbi:MAG TPA: hypothetical protein VFA56_00100 [Gaiellaceae bacterium]|nr:hypothetical protein [Gaiellaceae bacterium]
MPSTTTAAASATPPAASSISGLAVHVGAEQPRLGVQRARDLGEDGVEDDVELGVPGNEASEAAQRRTLLVQLAYRLRRGSHPATPPH